MGAVIRPKEWHAVEPRGRSAGPDDGGAGGRRDLRGSGWLVLAAVLAPLVVSVALIPARSHLDSADDALILVVAIVAVASTGSRRAAFVAALASALCFDFFLTHPYYSLRISRHSELVTEVLLLVVGLAVGELAARGRRHRDAADEGRHQLALLHTVTELAATGQDPELVVASASQELREVLELRDCHFTERTPTETTARITPAGEVRVGSELWATEALGLPTRSVDLPVRSGGWLLGHFLLTPTPGRSISRQRLLVAVALADQVGSALAGGDSPNSHPGGPDTPGDGQLREG